MSSSDHTPVVDPDAGVAPLDAPATPGVGAASPDPDSPDAIKSPDVVAGPDVVERAGAGDVPDAADGRDRDRRWWRRLLRDRGAALGGVLVLVSLLVALFAPLITRLHGVDPYTYHLDLLQGSGVPRGRLGGVSWAHPFGVEPQTGRDLFAIVVQGTRVSLSIGLGATALSMLIAIVLGLSAGYFGGWWDALVSRLTDVTLGFPHLVFMIAVSAIIPAHASRVLVMILIIGILGWPGAARVLRSRTMALRRRTFVQASRAMGAGRGHVVATQVLPNLVATIIVFTTISIPGRIGAEATLSFLGVGVTPPTPSWGRTIGTAITWVSIDPWYLLFPGAALFLVTLAFNLFGDGLRDALDPRTGGRS